MAQAASAGLTGCESGLAGSTVGEGRAQTVGGDDRRGTCEGAVARPGNVDVDRRPGVVVECRHVIPAEETNSPTAAAKSSPPKPPSSPTNDGMGGAGVTNIPSRALAIPIRPTTVAAAQNESRPKGRLTGEGRGCCQHLGGHAVTNTPT